MGFAVLSAKARIAPIPSKGHILTTYQTESLPVKKLLLILTFTTAIGCSQAGGSDRLPQNEVCTRLAKFGDTDICLPKIDEMTECYKEPIVKTRADQFNAANCSILGYYVPNTAYAQVDKFDRLVYDDYFQIFCASKFLDREINNDALDLMVASFNRPGYFDTAKEHIEAKAKELTIGKLVFLEVYSPNSACRTIITLIKSQVSGAERVQVGAMDFVNLKNRLVYVGYYKDYDGPEAVQLAKTKNERIVREILEANKS